MASAPRALWVMLFAVIVIIGGVALLASMDVPPPAQPYEKTLDLRATAAAAPAALPAAAPAHTALAPTAAPPASEE